MTHSFLSRVQIYYINPKSQNSYPKTRNHSPTKKLRVGLQQWRGEAETTRWADRVLRTKPRPEVHPADPSLLLLTLGVHRPRSLSASSPLTVKRCSLSNFGVCFFRVSMFFNLLSCWFMCIVFIKNFLFGCYADLPFVASGFY